MKLEYSGRYSTIDLEEMLDCIHDSPTQIKEAEDWLIENKFGSMVLDW